jgi:hypothetical protein
MLACSGGILLAFIMYGLLQERIMTQPYGEEGIYFKSSAYLVLNNRIVAILLAIIFLRFRGESLVNQAPLHKCASISVSNTLATFCQVRFPHPSLLSTSHHLLRSFLISIFTSSSSLLSTKLSSTLASPHKLWANVER